MTDVTRILNAIERGDAKATDELLPLVYEELRVLAAQKLSQEKPGQTLQATALVHEAYLRLVGDGPKNWNGRHHFFMAAAEATRGKRGQRWCERVWPVIATCRQQGRRVFEFFCDALNAHFQQEAAPFLLR